MLQRLGHDRDDPEKPRRLLDQQLRVGDWRSIGRSQPVRHEVPDRTPSWWAGDEEASQSFMQAMRIVVTDGSST